MSVPTWFYGVNALLELVATLACFLIFYFALKVYRLTEEKKYRFFSLAFLLLGISFLARTLLHLLIFPLDATSIINKIQGTINYGSPFYMLLTLAAYLIISAVCIKIQRRKIISILFLISLIGLLFSTHPMINFHFISIVLLLYIISHFIKNYTRKQTLSSLMTLTSFLFILGGHVLFAMIIFDVVWGTYLVYLLAHLFQLIGYCGLLLTVAKVLTK